MAYGLQIRNAAGNIVFDVGHNPFDFIETLTFSAGDSGSKTYPMESNCVAMIIVTNAFSGVVGSPPVVDSLNQTIFWDIPNWLNEDVIVGVYRGEVL
jgi:hypothetical protein